jgi:DinB superfamily
MHPLLENYQKQTSDLLDAIALFPERSRSIAPEGEWSAAFVVHHIADAELHFAARYLFILGSENPLMVPFDEDRYPEALHYEKRSVSKSLASIVGIRAMVLEILSAITDDSWSRVTTSVDGNTYSLTDLLRKASEHMVAHIEQLISLHSQL